MWSGKETACNIVARYTGRQIENLIITDKTKRELMTESGFGEHNMLVYPDVETFKEMHCMYAKIHLQPKYNEILLIVTYYETHEKIKQNLRDYGVNAEAHEQDGSLMIIDAGKGYQSSDVNGVETGKITCRTCRKRRQARSMHIWRYGFFLSIRHSSRIVAVRIISTSKTRDKD